MKKGDPRLKNIHASADRACAFLKTMSNKNRLVILCALADGEKNVTELAEIVGIRQPALSQQLARLRADGVVATRREQNQIHYHLTSDDAEILMGVIFELFCAGSDEELPDSKRRSGSMAAVSEPAE